MAAVMDETNDTEAGDSLAQNRSRRTRHDKTGRLAALQRLKQAKASGERIKYEVNEEAVVYDEVDEDEYSKIVQERQEDDWIIDDDGSGYVEDGREIFDEDVGEVSQPAKGKKSGADKKKNQNPNIRAPNSKPKSIKSMFGAMAVKPKKKVEKEVNLDGDDILGDILQDLKQDPATTMAPAPVKIKKKAPTKPAFNPFSTKVAPKRPMPVPVRVTANKNLVDEPATPPGIKLKKVSARPALKTALDNLDNDMEVDNSPTIEEYDTQESKENVNAQDINVSGVELTDIDFDEDFGEEPTKLNGHSQAEIPEDEGIASQENSPQAETDMPELNRTSWETVKGDASTLPVDVQVDSSKLPLTTNEEGEQVLRMFWLDAYEDYFKQPGVVYMFGKVWIESAKTHVSCCVAVKNIERRIYLLPRETRFNLKTKCETSSPVSFIDVYQEFNDVIAERYKIMKFKSMKVVREYAFEKADVPVESDYLEVRYSAEIPTLPSDLQGETFSHIFGSKTSSLELFLLDRKLKGPGWIDIKMPQLPNPAVSWCKVEAFVNKPDYVTVLNNSPAPPPLILMTMDIRTLPNPKTHQNEIIGAACLVQHEFNIDKPAPKKQPFNDHFCAITKPGDCIFPYDFKDKVLKQSKTMKVEIMGTERALLGFFLAKIHKVDPDVIVGHDVFGFDLDVLLHRINQNKIPHWSRIGRLKRATMPKLSAGPRGKGGVGANACSGRLVCDVKISAKELMRCRSYDLTELVSQILKEKRTEVDLDQIRNHYNSSAALLQLVELTLVDASYILKLMYELNVLPLALQITNICGNVMARTLLGGRSERNEYLLLHAFTEKNFIVPDKEYKKKVVAAATEDDHDEDGNQSLASTKKNGRRKPAYAGGLVLEPKKGFYDKFILLLDFNSLYPSIIQEYNICFTTISRKPTDKSEQQEGDEDDDLDLELPDSDLEPGVLPTEIRKLVQSRRQVKQLMKAADINPEMYMQYDIRQKALKLTANSMYGCLGFTFSRFYAKPLAALITSKGREILMKTKDLVENMNLEVIYGDTDSIMVNTNSTDIEQVFKLGNKVKNEVNKLYKLLEIDIDGVFKSMLLLKKKKYAALSMSKVGDKYVCQEELKGLDIVRRDWCELAKEAGKFVVSQILSGESRETIVENIHSKLIEVGTDVQEGKVSVELFQISKALTKNPEDYPDKKSLPHVQVALRLNSKGGRRMRAGDTIYYVVCEDGSNLPASQRAYHPDELAKSDNLKIDMKYYLAQQVHPVVARLCDPIDGTDAAHIAECLGLDASGYRQSMAHHDQDEDDAMLGCQVSEEERYKDCDRLKFNCPTCSKEIIFDSVFSGVGQMIECSLAKCPNSECRVQPAEHPVPIMNKLSVLMRSHIKKYYEGWLKCEDSACGARMRKVPMVFNRSHPVCSVCHRGTLHPEYTDSMLYNQLSFYQYIFDVEKAQQGLSDAREKDTARQIVKSYTSVYRQIKTHIERRIKHSAYSEVNLTKLFEGLFTLK